MYIPPIRQLFYQDQSVYVRLIKRKPLRLVYRVVGSGTAEFALYQPGDIIMILGILGNGFPLEAAEGKRVVVMGGGIGVPPLLQTAKELSQKGTEVTAVMGYRNEETFLSDDFKKYAKMVIATEDGSVGTKGNVIDAMKNEHVECDVILACGVGACLGCVCKTKEVDHHSHVHNARICTDGPVFDAEDVEI